MTSRIKLSASEQTVLPIIWATSFCHLLNDVMQSMIAAIYPMLKTNYALDYWQIGILTLAFQCTASLLQPFVGMAGDRRALPLFLPVGMFVTFLGLLLLAGSKSFVALIVGASLVGVGSAVFHPEASRVARLAAGARYGFAQAMFQVGGNFGQAAGPLIAAFIVVPNGQASVRYVSILALLGIAILCWVANWHKRHDTFQFSRKVKTASRHTKSRVIVALGILALLTFSKNAYMASIASYYTFYVMERFDVSVSKAQVMLFIFLAACAVGTMVGGQIGDRFGPKAVLWFSILGVLPFTLLMPFCTLPMTIVLSVIIGLIMASSFPAIVVMAQGLVPGRVGLVSGIFFGLAFGVGGITAGAFGVIADQWGISTVFDISAFLPALGVLTIFLPSRERREIPTL